MNWLEVICAAIGGAIGGGVGGVLTGLARRHLPRSKIVGVLMASSAIAFAGAGAQFGRSQRLRDLVSPPTRFELVLRKYTGIMESPAFKLRLSALAPDKARQAGAEWSHAGLKRLGREDLDSWNAIRTKMARSSKPVCAGLWTGRMDTLQLMPQIEALSDPDLETWARLSMTAARLEVEATGPAASHPEALARGLRTIAGQLSANDASRFQRDIERGTALADDEACWAMLTVSEGAQNLQPADREPFLRALASL